MEESKERAMGIVKMSSKGQVTIPTDLRGKLDLKTGDYFYAAGVGKSIILTKVERTPFEEAVGFFQRLAREKGVTREEIDRTIKEIREKRWREKHEKAI